MTEHYYAAIMAGGGGTRLWPMSRKSRPKQSLQLFGDQTLFQMAVNRLKGIIPIERTMILTIAEQAAQLRLQVSALSDSNFILEPGPKGTASVIGLAAVHLRKRDPEAVMACLTADHYIPAVEAFQDTLRLAYEVAQGGMLVTLGITPTTADTGYGYIKRGAQVEAVSQSKCYWVETFTEKPDMETANKYLKQGGYYWNSGMFIWQVDAILHEIEKQLPDLHRSLMEIEPAIDSAEEWSTTKALWEGLANITVDYGVMEGAEQVVVLPADDLSWVDIGDWGRLFDILPHNEFNNVLVAEAAELVDSSGVLVYQDAESSDRLIAGLGLENLVIIDTGEVLFACERSKAAELKKLIERIKQVGQQKYL